MQAARFWTHVVVLGAIALMAGCSDNENNGDPGPATHRWPPNSCVQELRAQRLDVQTHLQGAAAIQAGLFK